MALFSADMRIVLLLRVTESSIQEMGSGLTEPRVEETGGVRLFRAYSQEVSFATCPPWIHRNEVWLKSNECTAGSVVGCIPGCRSNAHLPRQKAHTSQRRRRMGFKLFSLRFQRPRSLLFAAIADHTDVGHLEMAVFGRVLVHAVLFHFIFDFLFGAVQVCSSHFAGHGYGMTPVRRESDCLAVKLPGGTIFGC